jgi:integrase/recombinase XerD
MMASEREATRSTLSAYEADLCDFYAFLKGGRIESVTVPIVQAYIKAQSNLSPSTRARRLSCLRQFYAYLIERGVVRENPATLVKLPPHPSKALLCLSPEAAKQFWENVQTGTDPEERRLALLVYLLCMTDLSVDGIVSLPVYSSDMKLPFSIRKDVIPAKAGIHKKNISFRTVSMDPRLRGDDTVRWQNKLSSCLKGIDTRILCEHLTNYLAIRPAYLKQGEESPWLFPSRSQKGHLTRQRFGQLLKEHAVRTGVDPRTITLATVRRSLAFA